MFSETGVYSYSAVLMGSPILLKLYQLNQKLAGNVFRLIKQQEDIFTVNRPHSEVMAINRAAGKHAVAVSRALYGVIKRAKEASVLPDSRFNLTIGPLVKRWKIGFNGNSVPTEPELRALLTLTDPRQVGLDDATASVYLQRLGMEIDLGAIAKGYIADVVRDYLLQQGVSDALINLGGNVLVLGNSVQQAWRIGLKQPFAADNAPLGIISVANKSVVTSGIYERYFMQDGRCYHHILDPQTGYPLDNELLSVTVICDNAIDGDIWTTLMYGQGVRKGLETLSQNPGIEAIFITRNRQIICSSQRYFGFNLLNDSYQLTDSTA
ncbi:FAD:protein FMN transferase [Erwinia pyrifoliae]|uniref:FAD:protein FMN transferase n=1 Tax=Erwinia pyrifoliae TaxID=79967 RepID=A0ABY5X3G7_ERWPY|nr:FAD:protein FMN transferase [Erwinia pyrifoliae]MCT2387413.1 FAD:protein FMN transferase [Erwinia pyrifoliae]MCU8586987.1 FAD:protein FMN transferase [Erwinia pyrifoliae]UWS30855.1 FAD:protein FMN transferase [Erwinia pyrifoliae]UWS31915.1 FAD:protein FMN transferase [Erwinia pyrifoliae]